MKQEKKDALSQTFWNIFKKLPVFFFAVAACLWLYCLDSYKRSYDHAKKELIFVNDRYLDELGTALRTNPESSKDSEVVKRYTERNPIKTLAEEEIKDSAGKVLEPRSVKEIIREAVELGRFKSGEEMLEAIQQSIASDRDEKIKYLTLTADNLAKVIAAAPAPPESGQAKPGPTPTPDNTRKIYEDKTKALLELNAGVEKAIKGFKDEAAAKYRLVATTLTNPKWLEPKFVRPEQRPAGILYPAFEPVLDEQGGLYLIYQMLWLAGAGLLLFCLIAVVSRAFRLLLMPDGTATLTERAKDLLVVAREVPSAGTAKSAALSLAALGAATAVAVGGVAVNTKANRALAATVEAEAEAAPGKTTRNPFKRQPAAAPAPAPSPGQPPDLGPLVTSLDSIGGQLNGISQTITRLSPAGDVTSQLNTINNLLSTKLPEDGKFQHTSEVTVSGLDKYTDAVNGFSTKVEALTGKFEGLTGSMAACCKATPTPTPVTTPSPTQTPATPGAPPDLTGVQKSLDEILIRLKSLEENAGAAAPPAKPYRQGIMTRLLPPYGDDLYMLRADSYRTLENFMRGMPADGLRITQADQTMLLEALRDMVGEPPAGKDAFTSALKTRIAASLKLRQDKRAPADVLQPWRETILKYARIR